jgi:hypothetical protein
MSHKIGATLATADGFTDGAGICIEVDEQQPMPDRRNAMTRLSQAKPRFLAGLFLICMCGLMLQIIATRILSVISWYHLAFFSISMAMFGMTAGSLLVYFKERWFPIERLFENMVWICSAFAIAVEVSTLLLISTVLMIGGSQNS